MKLRNLLIVLFLSFVLLGATVFASDSNANDSNKAKPEKTPPVKNRGYNLIGLGVAVNQSDNTDFESVRIQVQHVGKLVADENATGKGLLFFGDEKYRLKEGIISEDNNVLSAKANIYDKDGVLVGSLSLAKVKDKPNGKAVGIIRGNWSGTITLNGKTYNAFLPTVLAKKTIDIREKLQQANEEKNEKQNERQKELNERNEKAKNNGRK